ncbi:MAG: FAD-dependent oxidoreductase [Propionibacteriaceae bacterium]|nr:FAD-dependent oxidoreductase [Propionibacteriaceae bacterium]
MGMDVIVIGAGYAGLLAANRMARRARVLLVDRRDRAVDRIRLHQLVAGTRDVDRVAQPIRRRLHRRAELVTGEVVDVAPGRVRLADDRELSTKHVLVACGRGVAKPRALDSLEGALALRDELARLRSGSVEIIGAGLTGIETAAEIAAARPELHVRLIHHATPGDSFAPKAQDHLLARLDGLGVELSRTPSGADLSIDATGPESEPLATAVDQHLRVLDGDGTPIPGLWAAGDAARIAGRDWLRTGCASAMPMGAAAADAILATLAGREVKPLDFGYDKRVVSLGRGDGIYEFLRPDGATSGRALTGRAGGLGKEFISRAAWVVPARFSRAYGPIAWGKGPR